MIPQQSFHTLGFREFLFKSRQNRIAIHLTTIAIILQFGAFKYLYPYASYIYGDSFSYLDAAFHNMDINTYLIGYSKFLRLVSVFSKSDTILVAIQYLLIQGSALYMIFSIFYFYNPSKPLQYFLLGFMVLNPLFLHLANLISSDCLFTALSLAWFTMLLWLINKPSVKLLIWHALIIFIAFTVRYNAIIYPFISLMAFWLSRMHLRKKLIGFSLSVTLIVIFIFATGNYYKDLTGKWLYSPFSGWMLTNNALYAYRYVDSSDRQPVPKRFQAFDNMVRQYYDSTHDARRFPVERIMASTFYMWSKGMPMVKFQDSSFKKEPNASNLKKWASMGPFYKDYGIYIIKLYPSHFARYFIWPNANKYYAPPIEFLEQYNSGKDSVKKVATTWFNYKSHIIKTRMKDFEIHILDFYPILSGVINVVMLFTLICYMLLRGWANNPAFGRFVFLGITIWLLNAGFTIFASSAALRFQSFPILLTTTTSLLLVDWMLQLTYRLKPTRETSQENLQPG